MMQRQRRQAFPFHSRTHAPSRRLLQIIDRASASLVVFHFIVKSERTALHLHWKGRNAISFAVAGRHFETSGSATFGGCAAWKSRSRKRSLPTELPQQKFLQGSLACVGVCRYFFPLYWSTRRMSRSCYLNESTTIRLAMRGWRRWKSSSVAIETFMGNFRFSSLSMRVLESYIESRNKGNSAMSDLS